MISFLFICAGNPPKRGGKPPCSIKALRSFVHHNRDSKYLCWRKAKPSFHNANPGCQKKYSNLPAIGISMHTTGHFCKSDDSEVKK